MDKQKEILVLIDQLHMNNFIIKVMLINKVLFIVNQLLVKLLEIRRKFIQIIYYLRGKIKIKFYLKNVVKITF